MKILHVTGSVPSYVFCFRGLCLSQFPLRRTRFRPDAQRVVGRLVDSARCRERPKLGYDFYLHRRRRRRDSGKKIAVIFLRALATQRKRGRRTPL